MAAESMTEWSKGKLSSDCVGHGHRCQGPWLHQPVRFQTQEFGRVVLHGGNLRSQEEVELVMGFLAAHELDEYAGCLVTPWPGRERIH